MRPIKKDFSNKTKQECDEAALARVYRSLSASEQSSKKLISKMELEGYPSSSIDFAITRAESLGILSDHRYCDMLVRSTISQGKGMQKCLKEIEDLGIDPMTLDSYTEYIEDEEVCEEDRALQYLEDHPPHAKDVRSSAFRKLVGKGYSFEVASKAASSYFHKLKNN